MVGKSVVQRADAVAGALRRRLHETGLLPRLLVVEVLLLALLGLGSLALIGTVAGSLRASREREWLLLGRSTALSIDEMLEDGRSALVASASRYREDVGSRDPARLQEILDQAARASPLFSHGVVVVDANHRIRAADQRHRALVGQSLAPVTLARLDGAGASSVEIWGIHIGGDGLLGMDVPLDGSPTGPAVVGLIGGQDSPIRRLLTMAVRLGQSGHAELVDRQCRVLVTTELHPFLGPGDHPTFCRQRWAQAGAGVGIAAIEQDEPPSLAGPHLMAFVPLANLPWALEIGTTVDDVYSPANTLLRGSAAVLLGFTALAILATVLIVRMLVRPITRLSTIAQRVARGETDEQIAVSWGGEIGELARSLETMRRHLAGWATALEQEVRQRTAELEQRNAELRALYDDLRQKEAQRQALLEKTLTAQEDERRRVSRELHDGIGQAFWALALQLERLQTSEGCPPGLRAELAALQRLASDSLRDLRRLTVALRPAALDDLGLVPAIRRYAEIVLGEAGIEFVIESGGLDRRLDPALETVIYRIVQEAINNVARHSQARRTRIDLRREGGVLSARVADDGRGFDPATPPGAGLQGMEERAALVGGTVGVQSAPGRGTVVTLRVPVGRPAGEGNSDREDDPHRG